MDEAPLGLMRRTDSLAFCTHIIESQFFYTSFLTMRTGSLLPIGIDTRLSKVIGIRESVIGSGFSLADSESS